MKKKKVYWLCNHATSVHEARAKILAGKGFEVIFFNEIKSLLDYYNRKRVNVIVLGDDNPPEVVTEALDVFVSHPNLYGIRLIFSAHKALPNQITIAYQWGIRDILPFHLSDKVWSRRFIFAVHPNPTNLKLPEPQLSLRELAGVFVPGRISWLGNERLRIETRIEVNPQANFALVGAIAEQLGAKSIPLVVESRDKKHLRFHYADAYICRFNVSKGKLDKLAKLLAHAGRDHQADSTIKVFAAIKSREIRQMLYRYLIRPRFEVATALSKNQITQEPKFLSPNLVIMDAEVLAESGTALFGELLAALEPQVPVVVIGDRENIDDLKELAGSRPVHLLRKVRPERLADRIENDILSVNPNALRNEPAGAVMLKKDSVFSFCELYLPARIVNFHPEGIRFKVPLEIGRYSFVRLESPFFRKRSIPLYGKVIRSFADARGEEELRYTSEVLMCSTTRESQKWLSNLAVSYLSKSLGTALPKDNTPTPEVPSDFGLDLELDLGGLPSGVADAAPPPSGPATVAKIRKAPRPRAVKRPGRSMSGKDAVNNAVTLLIVLAMVAAFGVGLIWVIEQQGPTASSQAYSKEFEKLQDKLRRR